MGKGQFLGEGSSKGEGEVLSNGWGASIRRKNIWYTKKRRFVSRNTQIRRITGVFRGTGELKKKL